MTRRKLLGRIALSGMALSSVGTVAASTSLAVAPSAGLTRLSLNENPLGPSPLAAEAIQNALTGIARYAGDDAHALEQQIAKSFSAERDRFLVSIDPMSAPSARSTGNGVRLR
jgi:histidinol-phosphate/aromatic aminotransferase/cobyric acid decarboxylase-like protein